MPTLGHIWSHVWGCAVYLQHATLCRSSANAALDSSETVFDGFMNAAAVAHNTAQVAQTSNDIVAFVVAHSIYEHCLAMATSFDSITNYSPSPHQ